MHELMRDAAFAGNIPSDWNGAVAGYLNTPRAGDAFHAWSEADWKSFPDQRKLPIFVQSHPGGAAQGREDGWHAVRALRTLGLPSGKLLRTALDLETAVDPPYVRAYGGVLRWAGFHVWVYGSASTVFRNPALDGYWVANYVSSGPFMYDHPEVRATQYTNNPPAGAYDSSTVKEWVWLDKAHWWVHQ
jgi:hypothetical protein